MGKVKINIAEDTPASEQELAWMAELKELHTQERLTRNSVSDTDLLRFCRAYVNNEAPKETSFKAVKEYLEWREAEKIDELASHDYGERYTNFVSIWPCGLSGIDKTNHPVYFDCMGNMDPSTLGKAFTFEEFRKYHIQMMESLQDVKVALSERLEKPVYKHTVVIDLDGFGFKHVWDRTAINGLIELDSSKYPETLHKMLVINTPFVFKAIFAMFSGLLDETTKSRIHMLKKPEDLLEHIDASQLPKKYGGLIDYPKDVPLFSVPFKTADGHSTEFDDIFSGLLEKRQARLAKKDAEIAAAEGTTTTTTTTTDDATVAAEEKPAETAEAAAKPDEATPVEATPIAEDSKPESDASPAAE